MSKFQEKAVESVSKQASEQQRHRARCSATSSQPLIRADTKLISAAYASAAAASAGVSPPLCTVGQMMAAMAADGTAAPNTTAQKTTFPHRTSRKTPRRSSVMVSVGWDGVDRA